MSAFLAQEVNTMPQHSVFAPTAFIGEFLVLLPLSTHIRVCTCGLHFSEIADVDKILDSKYPPRRLVCMVRSHAI